MAEHVPGNWPVSGRRRFVHVETAIHERPDGDDGRNVRARRPRGDDGGLKRSIPRHSSKLSLSVFVVLVVVVLGTLAPGVMMLEFSAALGNSGSGDVTADLVCDPGGETVTCRLEEPIGFDHVVVTSGDRQLERIDEPPYEFTVQRDELAETRNGAEFVVELKAEDGTTLRRFVRTV